MKNLMLLSLVVLLLGCQNEPPDHPPVKNLEFIKIKNQELGYLISLPSNYSIQQEGAEIHCRMDGFPVLMINYVSMEEGDRRGLWPDHKPDKNQAAPNGWILYSYTHYDGPFGMATRSYVKKMGNKYLSLDFRLKEEDREVERIILRSFVIESN